MVHINPKVDQEVHWDQIKKCISHPELEKLYPTVYRRGEPIVSIPEANIKKILDTKWDDDGLHFLVEWTEGVGGGQNWVDARQLSPTWSQALAQALATRRE